MRRGRALLSLTLPWTLLCLAPTAAERRAAFDFRYDVLPLLHSNGCGSAYCHGSATGRGGFKLSLFASDPAADHAAIVRDLDGRRLDFRDPANSLLLRKPTMRTTHGGGRRLRVGTDAFRALTEWIAAGAPFREGRGRELLGLRLQRDGGQLRASARFRDARGAFDQDVTGLCTFRSSDDRVVSVDAEGRIVEQAPGEAWLFARYVNRSARLAVVRPFGPAPSARPESTHALDRPSTHALHRPSTHALDRPSTHALDRPSTHALDRLWVARLREFGLSAAPTAATSTLARRLYLDLADRLPTPDELRVFRALAPADRVARTATKLMRSHDFAEKFGRHLAQWMEIPLEPPARPNPRTGMFAQQHRQLVAAVARGDSLQAIARRLIVEDRRLIDRFADPRDRSELAGRAFLGIRIGCARCHDSPVDKWQRKDHMAFSALFATPRPDPDGGMQPGVLFDPETGEPVRPRILPVDAAAGTRSAGTAAAAAPSVKTRPVESPAAESPAADHAETVARFVLHGDHGMFARNIANRTFAALFGRGLVEPVDDHRSSNPAVHESILLHLATVAARGDLRELVLHIVTSRMYQASSAPAAVPHDAANVRYFARREARSVPPETFANAVARALGTRTKERLTRSPLARQLALLNSRFLHDAVATSAPLADIALFAPDAATRLHDLFVLLLSREPRAAEVAALLPGLRGQAGAGAVSDLAFALLASREFGSIR